MVAGRKMDTHLQGAVKCDLVGLGDFQRDEGGEKTEEREETAREIVAGTNTAPEIAYLKLSTKISGISSFVRFYFFIFFCDDYERLFSVFTRCCVLSEYMGAFLEMLFFLSRKLLKQLILTHNSPKYLE